MARHEMKVKTIVQNDVDHKCFNKSVSNGWWGSFIRRNPNISLKAAAPLSMASAKATDPVMLGRYFNLLERTLNERKTKSDIKHGQEWHASRSKITTDSSRDREATNSK